MKAENSSNRSSWKKYIEENTSLMIVGHLFKFLSCSNYQEMKTKKIKNNLYK